MRRSRRADPWVFGAGGSARELDLTSGVAFFYSRKTVRKSLVVGMLVVGAGCSTTSTVSRISGPSVEGDIVGGSPDEIFVSNNAGGDFAIPRSDISEIDYPGNVHTLVGGIVAGYGVLNIVAGLDNCQHEHDNQGAVCTGVFLPAAIGVAMMTWGIIVNQGQKAAAADTSRPSAGAAAQPDGGQYPAWASGHRVAPPPQQPPPPGKPSDASPPAPPPPPGASGTAPAPSEPLPPLPPPPAAAPPPPAAAPPPPVPPAAAPPPPAKAPAPAAPPAKAPAPAAPPSKGFPVEK